MHARSAQTKLLIVSDYFYPHWTGIAKSMYYFVHAMSATYEISVLTVRFNQHLASQENIFGVRVMRENYLFPISRAKYSLNIIVKFLAIVKDYDEVLVNSPFSNIVPIVVIAKLFRKKVIVLHHGDLQLPSGLLNRLIEAIFLLASRIACTLADTVSTFTTDYAQHSVVLQPYTNKFQPMIIPIGSFMQQVNGHTATHVDQTLQAMRNEKKIIFGFAGRFVEEKGFDILFTAIPNIIEKVPNAHFVYAGEVNMAYEKFFQKIEHRMVPIKKHLTMLGLLPENELRSFYKHCNFIVIPSRSDCFPIVQMEAMMVGVPAIVSDIPGLRVLVTQTGFGRVFEKGNPDALAEACSKAVKEEKKLQATYPKVVALLDEKKLKKEMDAIFS